MKKTLLTFAALAMTAGLSFGQQRLVLYEEFTGENCGPCAATNPHLDSMIAGQGTFQADNATKVLMIKYMSPIPSAGQFYYQNQAETDSVLSAGGGPINRRFYSVDFAPKARLNGFYPDYPQTNYGHPGLLTQADINAQTAIASPFNITVTNTWNATYDSVIVNVGITCVSAYAPSGANLHFRSALIETVNWATPPGNNGEKDFPNVVRTMAPYGQAGLAIANSWTVGQTQNLTYKLAVPDYVDKTGGPFTAVWIQNDHITGTLGANDTLAIPQAARASALPNIPKDVASTGLTLSNSILCTAATASTTPTVTIKNTGANALTSATIFYKVDNGSWTSQAWTGNLAANATANVALPAQSLTPGSHVIYDSVGQPNGVADYNTINNNSSKLITVVNTTTNPLPSVGTGFENGGNLPANWVLYDANGNGMDWFLVHSTTSMIGHGNSEWTIYHDNFEFDNGEKNYAIIPTPTISGPVALDFWTAHKGYAGYTDALDVVYSTNCGSTWTSVWHMADPQLNNGQDTTAFWVPTQAYTWTQRSANLSSVPAGAIVALMATSGFGNSLFVDDIAARSGFPLGVSTLSPATTDMISIFPNPAKETATLQFNLNYQSNVQVNVVDITGRVVSNVANTNMGSGQQQIQLSTANLPEGVYNVMIQTDGGVSTQRLTVVK